MAAFCSHCGSPLGAGAGFCGQCGQTQAGPVRHIRRPRSKKRWPWIAGGCAVAVLAGVGLAGQRGWIELPGFERSADSDGDGVISSDEMSQEFARVGRFRPGQWKMSDTMSGETNGKPVEGDMRQSAFVVDQYSNYSVANSIFHEILDIQITDYNQFTWKPDIHQKCVARRFRVTNNLIRLRMACMSNGSIEMTGSYDARHFDLTISAINLNGPGTTVSVRRIGQWVSDQIDD